MDLANYSRSLSQMITQEVFRDCSMACLSDNGVPDKTCITNCTTKSSQLLSAFDSIIKSEIPRLQELSRIQ